MSLNTLENALRYTGELDKLYVQKSATGFFADNNMRSKFVGAKTVLIPDVDFQGLADYDRDYGFSRGAITVANTSYTMQMDRARSLQIDREDLDETGVANLAGQVLGEYVRTKVVPECDAYVLSKLAGIAINRSNLVEGTLAKPYEALCKLINEVQSAVGYDEELVVFIDSRIFATLQNTTEISRMITVSDFKQGEINLKVKSINGVSLIPIPSNRLFTAAQSMRKADIEAETEIQKAEYDYLTKVYEANLKAQQEAGKYVINKSGGALSYGYQGSFSDNKITKTDNGNGTVTYYDGNSNKQTTLKKTQNPYTLDDNSSLISSWGAFDNGYQYKGVIGVGAFVKNSKGNVKKSGTIDLYGENEINRSQNVFSVKWN